MEYVLGDPWQGGTATHRLTIAGPLNPGDSTSFDELIPNFPEDKLITVWARVDPDGSIEECNVGNNASPAEAAIACAP